jgi:glycosyltransferase involved in cell wall biosynthesis
MADPALTIAYSTIHDRAGDIQLPAPNDDTEILLVVQGGPGPFTSRDDVRVIELESLGVAKSRNVALVASRGEYVLFGDDDSTINRGGVDALLDYFGAQPDVAVVLGRSTDENSQLRKRYPSHTRRLLRWNYGKAGTIEVAVRRRSVVDAGVRFDEGFGAGAPNHLGDEYIFIADACAVGLRCMFVPITVASHSSESSGLDYGTMQDARARSAVFVRVFRRRAPIARLLFLLKSPRRFRQPSLMARFVMGRFPDDTRRDSSAGFDKD